MPRAVIQIRSGAAQTAQVIGVMLHDCPRKFATCRQKAQPGQSTMSLCSEGNRVRKRRAGLLFSRLDSNHRYHLRSAKKSLSSLEAS